MYDMKKEFRWDAGDYRESSSAQLQWARELLGILHLSGNERVLDIGCGDGKVTAEIAKRLPSGSVLGIDNSEEMIKFSGENFPRKKYPNLDFQLIDVSRIAADKGISRESISGSGRKRQVTQARAVLAYTWMRHLGRSGYELAKNLGVTPQALYALSNRVETENMIRLKDIERWCA